MSDEEPEFAMVMPFVVCASAGGPYDDGPFVAGYDLGYLDALLTAKPPFLERMVRTESVPQVDLIAMKHGYALRQSETELPEWTRAKMTAP